MCLIAVTPCSSRAPSLVLSSGFLSLLVVSMWISSKFSKDKLISGLNTFSVYVRGELLAHLSFCLVPSVPRINCTSTAFYLDKIHYFIWIKSTEVNVEYMHMNAYELHL